MKIFADRHHEALYQSLIYLFEDRLGHTLYHPYSMDWFPEHWHIARPYGDDPATASQFLESTIPRDGTEVLPVHRGISFSDFTNTSFDILIATYLDHILVYKELIKKYQPQAKLIAQLGNNWSLSQEQVDAVDGVLASIKPFPFLDKPIVFYHQEFKVPEYKKAPFNKQINSFVNALNINDIFKRDWRDFEYLELLLPHFTFHSYGGGCRDGSLSLDKVPQEMQRSMFGLHFKRGGDGYGHVIHSLLANGVPVIYKGSQYKHTLAEPLLIHGATGFDVDKLGLENVADIIKNITYEEHESMSLAARQHFSSQVDFDLEAQQISVFLDQLVSSPSSLT